jgi:uncharacterized protein (TIGR03437 family)
MHRFHRKLNHSGAWSIFTSNNLLKSKIKVKTGYAKRRSEMKLESIAAFALITLLGLPADAHAQSVSYTFAYEGPSLPIFKDSANIISVAYVFVPKAILITKVTANVEIDYPSSGDLNVYMYSPILTRTKLLERNCGSQGSVENVTFDDAAPTSYSSACPTSPGTYRPNEPLSNFNNQIALGTWSLAVENNGSDNTIGYLRGFTIVITGFAATTKPITSPDAVVNAASFQSAGIAPGEMINIQGFNLGPSPSVTAPAGDLRTSLGGVQVTFDGTPTALSYVSPYVLTVQVPFSLRPGAQTAMRVLYQNNSSDPVTLDVLNALPGVYTQSANGRGPVTALNPDGSINSLSHPVAKGQYVTVYASGLGTVSPPLGTGQTPPASPTSSTTASVTAVVDGLSANVLFAGAAPGFPGLYQINLQIPSAAASGAQPLTLFAAGAPNQSGVTIFVQ